MLSGFHLLRTLYGALVVPPAVYREVVESGAAYPASSAVEAALGDWISVSQAPVASQVSALRRECRLDLGESESILVAESLGRIPLAHGRPARRALRPAARPDRDSHSAYLCGCQDSRPRWKRAVKLDDLRRNGFHLAGRHYETILRELGEL